MINHNSKNRTSATADMSSKFKMRSGFLTHFKLILNTIEHSLAPTQLQPSLTEVYEIEIRRLREQNYHLRTQQNPFTIQLNHALHCYEGTAVSSPFIAVKGLLTVRSCGCANG